MSTKYKKLGVNLTYENFPYGIEASITSASSFSSEQNIEMVFNLKNNSRSPVWILKNTIPVNGEFISDIFEVKRNGSDILYYGLSESPGVDDPNSYIRIDAKQTYSNSFNPSLKYEMSDVGNYSIKYKSVLYVRYSAPQAGLSEIEMEIIDGDNSIKSLDPEEIIEPSRSVLTNFSISQRAFSTLEVIEVPDETQSANPSNNALNIFQGNWDSGKPQLIIQRRQAALESIINSLKFFDNFLINGRLDFTYDQGAGKIRGAGISSCILKFGKDPNENGPKCRGACGWFGWLAPERERQCENVCRKRGCTRISGNRWRCPLTNRTFANRSSCDNNCEKCEQECKNVTVDRQSQRAVFVRNKLIQMRNYLQDTTITWILSDRQDCGYPCGSYTCTLSYVAKNRPATIWICPQLVGSGGNTSFSNQLTRRIIHEVAHLNGVCCDHSEQINQRGGADTLVASLASSQPKKTIENADTYAAFALNACAGYSCC